jgi:titin
VSLTARAANGAMGLTWTPSVPGSYPLSGYQVWRSSCSTCPSRFSASVWGDTASSFLDSSLSNGALYTYTVKGFDDHWYQGALGPADNGYPAANPPTNLSALYDFAGGGMALSWTLSPGHKNEHAIVGYNIYRSTCGTCPWNFLVGPPTVGSSSSVYLDMAVTPASVCRYMLTTTTMETEGPLTPAVRGMVPPATPSALTVLSQPSATLFLEWSSNNTVGRVNGYKIYRTTVSGNMWQTASRTPQSATSYLDTATTFGQRYYYRVSAWCQNGADWAESLPTPEFYREVEPSHLALLDIDPWDAEARLSWVDLRMDQVVSNYRIYRSTQALLASTVFVGAVSTTQFTGWLYFNDSTVTNGITYNYWVAGDNEGGEGDLTPFAPITPYKPPQAPSFLSAMSGVNRVELTWSLTLVGTYGIQGYEVLWSKAPGAATMPQGMYTLGPSASTYSHTGLVNGTPYFYAVRAFDFNGNRGAASVEATVAPAVPPCAPTVMGAVSGTGWVETEWGIVNSSLCAPPGSFPIGGYYLYKSTSMGGGYVSATRLYGSAATAYFDSEVTQGQTYYYRVWTYDDQVPPNQTDEFFTGAAPIVQATPRIPAGAPGGLIIDYSSPFEHDGRLKLSWVASVPGTLPVIGYRIYRSTDDEAAATSTLFVSGAATETVLDTGLTNGIYYHYHVAAVDEKWQDGLVSAVSGTAFRDPLVPVGVTSFAGNTAIFVNWTAPAAQTTFPIGGYFIYRATYSGIVGAGVALAGAVPVGTSWFTDSAPPLVNGQAYYYHLKTYDDRGNASYAFSLETSTVPFAPPQAPTGLSLFSGPSRVSLSWDAPAPGTFPVSGYLVFRASYAEVPCGLNPVQKVVGVQTWVDHGVTNGLDYYYSVAAYDTVAPWHFGPCSATEMVTAGAVDPPSVPGGLSGTTGSMRVTLSWLASTMGTLPLSGYSVYRTTFTPNPADPLSPYDTTTSATAGAYSDLAATDGAVYYYRVRARDDSGVLSNYSNELRRMASTPPSGLAGDVSVANQVSVSWNFLADPSALSADARPVSGYVVYRSTVSAAAGYVELTRTMTCPADPAATSYIDATAIRGLPMYYRVSALYGDDMWEGTWSAPISATAVGPPSQPGLAASLTLTGALLSWVPAFSSISPVTSYGVYRATTAGVIDGDTTRTAFVVGGLSYADAGVVNGTFYYYQVAAYDKNTTSTYSDEVAVLPLGRPLALSAFPVDGAVKLAWTLPTGGTTGIDGYLVYRYTLSEGEVESGSVYSGSASVLTDSTPINGISYTYRVQAFAGDPVPAHWSLSSNSVQATPASPPTAPNNPGAVASSGLVTVCWTTPTSLGTNPLSGYRLYRATGPGNGYSALATVSQSTFCYSDMAVTNASSAVWQVYYYRIAAFDTGVPPVEGPPSNIVQGVPYYNPDPPLVLTTIPGNGTVRLVWVAPADTTYPATKYNIYRGVFAGAESAVAINALPTAATIYTDSGRTNGQRYFYKVRTLDSAGHLSVTSMEVSCIPFNPPSTPAAMTAHPGNGVVMLAWADSTAGTYPFAGYKIYRGSYPGGATTFVASVSGLKYVDMAGISATDYYYSVRGYDSQGHESVVLEVSASPNTTLVNPPFNVAAVPASAVITVSWTWTTNGSAPGGPITEYAILKGTCASCPLTSSAYVSSTVMQWSDTGMSNGSVVRYVVRAVNAAMLESGDYDGFNSVSAVSPFQAPTAPRNLVATGGMGVVELKWDAPINPGTQPITGYVVLRNSPACPCSVTLATLSSPTAVAYQDNSVVNGTAYQYQVVPLIWLAGSYWRGAAATSQVVTPNLRPNESFISANAFAPARGDRLDITFTLDRKSDVKVGIYTITGIKVWETTMNSVPAGPALGSYLVVGPDGMPGWDGKAGDGLTVSSGVYILRIETAGWKKALKVIVIK